MKKWMAIPALAGVVALGGMAIGANAEKSDVVLPTTKEFLTIEEVKAIAVKAVGGNVMEIEFERKKSGAMYEVEVKSKGVEYDLDIDAKTGKVLRTDKNNDDDDYYDDDKVLNYDGKLLTMDEAVAIAKKQAKGKVSKVELDDDDGKLYYEIEIKDGKYEYEFEIDAITGEVLEFEKDRDDD